MQFRQEVTGKSQAISITHAIDPDVLQTARERAETRVETLGKVVSDMMRNGLTAPAPSSNFRNGITLLPKRKLRGQGHS